MPFVPTLSRTPQAVSHATDPGRKVKVSGLRMKRLAPWAILVSMLVASASFAQTKGGTMKLIASGPAGTAVDMIARSLGTHLSASLGVTAIVDNKVGAGGNIAAESAAQSPADGMTLLIAANNVATINPFVYSKLKYNFADDLIAVGHLGGGGYILVANPKLGVRDVAGLVARAKQTPDAINYASYGIGSGGHICMELMQSMAGVQMKHVPYRSGTVTDLVGGVVDVGFEPAATVLSFVQSGKLLALGNSSTRADVLPAAAPVADTLPGYDCQAWIGVFTPRKTSRETLDRINSAIAAYVNSDSTYKGYAKTLGLQAPPADNTVQALDRFVTAEAARSKAVIQKLNISLD